MQFDPINFILSLTAAIAAATGKSFGQATPAAKKDLFAGELHETLGNDPCAVIRLGVGVKPEGWASRPMFARSIQVLARGASEAAVMRLLQEIYEAFYDDEGNAQGRWDIPGKKLVNGEVVSDTVRYHVRYVEILQEPSPQGADQEKKVYSGSFNVDVYADVFTS